MSSDNPNYHVMIDLETFGTKPDAALVAIGAVKFDPTNPTTQQDKFYALIHPSSSIAHGLTVDGDTLLWWMNKDQDAARADLLASTGGMIDLASALEGFATWFGPASRPVWGNGATFDNVILRNAFKVVGIPCPWDFWHDRCFRTLKNLDPRPREKLVVAHNALKDAESQVAQLLDITAYLGINPQ